MVTGWNGRYMAYAASQGRTPEAQAEVDSSGSMAGYLTWANARVREWRAEVGLAEHVRLSDASLAEFDLWLARWVAERAEDTP